MENKTSPGYANLEEPEYEISGHAIHLSNMNPSLAPNRGILADDIFLEDLPQEECFILNEDYVLLEEEYVMWEGTTPCKKKNKEQHFPDVFEEGALSLPEEDSLHRVGTHFTLKTETWPRRTH